MNILEITILAVLAFAVFFALRHIVKKRKSGCSGCCSECGADCRTARKK
ncbi:MAG: FeoB-associated Cys-rich membrane protein [Clostridia bacterium]|jgi:hypothetical protein|nr:FeoB-associated Cys-rich membrane protein [Clostridia bacterium]